MKIIKSKINRLCCIGISFLLIFGLTINYSYAQCDYVPGDTGLFANTGYNATGTNQVCYLVDAAGTVVASDPSGACDFPGLAYGAYSVYALNDCIDDPTTDIIASPPSTLAEIIAANLNADVDMAGPADFTVCPPSNLSACEGEIITVTSMPNYDASKAMMYVMVCDGIVTETSTMVPTVILTVPDDGNPATEPTCEVHALNFCSPEGDAAAAAVTPGATWTAVDPAPTGNFDAATAPISVCSLLPIKLSFFDARCEQDDTKLSWTTNSEENAFSFVIERSVSGNGEWTQVGQVEARGSMNTITNYSFTDERALGAAYYRLRVIQLNGENSYSPIQQIKCLENGIYDIFPNPTSGKVTITYEALDELPITFEILDVLGRVVSVEDVSPERKGVNTHTINFSKFPAAMYFLVLNMQNNETRIVEKIIKKDR